VAENWHWCGYPHHFIGGKDCLFHLATFVCDGRWLVSTVGDYRPNGGKAVTLGRDGLFETMVFATDPLVLTDGEPTVVTWSEDWGERYNDSTSAAQGHMRACNEYEARRG